MLRLIESDEQLNTDVSYLKGGSIYDEDKHSPTIIEEEKKLNSIDLNLKSLKKYNSRNR